MNGASKVRTTPTDFESTVSVRQPCLLMESLWKLWRDCNSFKERSHTIHIDISVALSIKVAALCPLEYDLAWRENTLTHVANWQEGSFIHQTALCLRQHTVTKTANGREVLSTGQLSAISHSLLQWTISHYAWAVRPSLLHWAIRPPLFILIPEITNGYSVTSWSVKEKSTTRLLALENGNNFVEGTRKSPRLPRRTCEEYSKNNSNKLDV